jgi:transposase
VTFKRQVFIRSKVVMANTILEEVNTFIYLGCKISYKKEKDKTYKTSKFLQSLGILNNVLKPNLV